MKNLEIKKRLLFRCIHRHDGMSHPSCYKKENSQERIGYFDIEASNLKANFGIILSYSLLMDTGELYTSVIKPSHLKSGKLDYYVVSKLQEDLKKVDRIITFFGTRFDNPYVRTRALYHNIEFPAFGGGLKHTDLYYIIRNKFCLHSNRLENACSFFGIKSKGHPLTPDIWIKCLSGNRQALDYVLTHNIEDVYSTKHLWDKVFHFVNYVNKSI